MNINQEISEIKNKHVSNILNQILKDDILTPFSIETLVKYIKELEDALNKI